MDVEYIDPPTGQKLISMQTSKINFPIPGTQHDSLNTSDGLT